MRGYKKGTVLIVTWHPDKFSAIGMEVIACSVAFYVNDVIPIEYFRTLYPKWDKFAHLLMQSVTEDGITQFLYPVLWMQPRRDFGTPYAIVDEKRFLTP